MRSALALAFAATLAGCGGAADSKPAAAANPAPKPQPVLGRKTKDIGKYDPNDKSWRIASLDVKYSNPVTGPLEAYGPMVGQISTLATTHALDLYNAEKGRYPNYKEFMAAIVNGPEGGMELPVQPGGKKYMYDEANHKLVVVEPAAPQP